MREVMIFFVGVCICCYVFTLCIFNAVIPGTYGEYNVQACKAKCVSMNTKVFMMMKNDNYCICTNKKVYKRKMSELYQ